ncbi:hypothetical protein EK21DRAFT_76308 [Setomelanomma holmii]|uniref:Uncharacterized protein n=1 Tax=Setomelanomma holmii TaxID=210430 RepID=A0A9P4H0D3_9PLEO|nr:hypothetical protein EK21DRAFT_76308 [Setomelanomma holmii]
MLAVPVDGATSTFGGLEISAKLSPAEILFRRPNPTPTPSTTPSLSAVLTTTSTTETMNKVTSIEGSSTPSATASMPAKSNSHTGVTNGATAGIAIGCLVAGALIAGLFFSFCLGKRKSLRAQDYEASSTALVSQEKGFASKTMSLGSGSPTAAPGIGTLPLPLEDKAITGEISKISNSIKNHVQSYYHTGRVSSGVLDFDDLQAIGDGLPLSVGTLSTLLGNSATREIALRFCIAWVICARMHPDADSNTSLLPREIAACSQKIASTNQGPGVHNTRLPRWRAMTAELLQSSYVRDLFDTSDSRNTSIQKALTALDNILQPYADSRMDNLQRQRNLEEILKRSALFAFTLFSQPSVWDFDWKVDQSVKSGELCVFPALVQLSDETGQAVEPPRPYSEALIRRLDV